MAWVPQWSLSNLSQLSVAGRRTATQQVRNIWDSDAHAVQVAKEVCFISGPYSMPRLAVMMAANPKLIVAPYLKMGAYPVASDAGGTKFPAKWYQKFKDGRKAQQQGTYVNWLMEQGFYAEAVTAATTISGVTATRYGEWSVKTDVAKVASTNAQAAQGGTHPFRGLWYDTAGTFCADQTPGFWGTTNPGWDPHTNAPYTPANWLDNWQWKGDLARNLVAGFSNINPERLWVAANGMRGGAGGKGTGLELADRCDMAMTEGWLFKFGGRIASTVSNAQYESTLQLHVDCQVLHGCVAQVLDWGAASGQTAAQRTQQRRFDAASSMIAARGLSTWEWISVGKSEAPHLETAHDPDLYGNLTTGGSKVPFDAGVPLSGHSPTQVGADWPNGHRVPVGSTAGTASGTGLYGRLGRDGAVLVNNTNSQITYKADRAYTLVPSLESPAATSYAVGASVAVPAQSAVFLTGGGGGGGTDPGGRWPASGVMLGAYTDHNSPPDGESQAEINADEAALGRKYALDDHFYGQGVPSDGFPEWDLQQGRTPLITTAFAWGQSTFPGYTAAQSGTYDTMFHNWATYLKGLSGTVIVRLFQEQNGNWFNYGTGNADYSTGFAAMWRYIWNLWKADGVDLGGDVQICWCPNTETNLGITAATTDASYPGDGFVDVIGIDLYNKDSGGTGAGASFQSAFSTIYGRYSGKGKPFIVPEFAVVDHVLDQRKNWLAAMRAYILGGAVPLLKGLAYWNARGTSNDVVTGTLYEYRLDKTTSGNPASGTDSWNQWALIAADPGFQAVMADPVSGTSAPSITAAPAVTGTPRERQTVYADPGRYGGTPAPGVTRQWQVSDTGSGGWSNIAGETGLGFAIPVGTVAVPTTLASDDFSDAQTDTWASADVGGAWAVEQGNTADFDKVGGVGTLTFPSANTTKFGSLNIGRAELEASVTARFVQAAAGGNVHASLCILFQDVGNYYRVNLINFATDGSVTATLDRVTTPAGGATTAATIGTSKALGVLAAGTALQVRFQREAATGTLRGRVWTGTEPTTWDWQIVDSQITAAGKVALRGQRGAGNTNAGALVSFDNLIVQSLPSSGGGTGPSYIGKYLAILETADNGVSPAVTSRSGALGPIVAGATTDPIWSTRPAVSGTAQEGAQLSASPGVYLPAAATVAYLWESSGTGNPGTYTSTGITGSTYTPPAGATGRYIRVAVTLTSGGVSTTTRSAAIGPVTAGAPVITNTVAPTITGSGLPTSASAGDVLTANTGAWTNAARLDTQWQVSDDGVTWSNIGALAGGQASTFTPDTSYAGRRIRIKVTGSNTAKSATPLDAFSAATPVVQLPGGWPNLQIAAAIE